MKNITFLIAGTILASTLSTANAATLMPNAVVLQTHSKTTNDTITGIIIDKGTYTSAPMYLFGEISGSTFPNSVATRSSEKYTLNIRPNGIWTSPIFYGDNKATKTGSSGCYFQFQLSSYGTLSIAYTSQGKANCSYSGQMITVDFTNF